MSTIFNKAESAGVAGLKIRPALPADLPGILALFAQPDLDNGRILTTRAAKNVFSKISHHPDFNVYVAEMDDRVVGTFEFVTMPRLGIKSGIVEDVAVAPELQGRKIGWHMMRFAIEKCADEGYQSLTLSSNLKREKAHRFYENLGFKPDGYSFLPHPSLRDAATDSFKIRAATERDIPSLLVFQKQLQQNQSSSPPQQDIARLLIDMKQYRYLKIYIAADDGEAAGMFQMLIMPNLGHMGTPSAVVEDFIVNEKCQNRGLEEQMFNFALLESKKAGCYKLALSMNEELSEKVNAPKHGLRFSLKSA